MRSIDAAVELNKAELTGMESAPGMEETKWFLVWIAVWVAALAVLLPVLS